MDLSSMTVCHIVPDWGWQGLVIDCVCKCQRLTNFEGQKDGSWVFCKRESPQNSNAEPLLAKQAQESFPHYTLSSYWSSWRI
jgi:hypothetical protein